jgi:hypothetical protein
VNVGDQLEVRVWTFFQLEIENFNSNWEQALTSN